ncbi:MAG: adenylate/guanylate cyclase domain-containing protein [Dehalococcoidia bacterium]
MVAYFLLLSALVVVALAVTAFLLAQNSLKDQAFKLLEVTSDFKATELEFFLEDQENDISRIAEIAAIRDAAMILILNQEGTQSFPTAYAELKQLVESAAAITPDLTEIFFLTDEGGRIFFSTDKTHEGEYRVSDYYFTEGRIGSVTQNVYPSPVTFAPSLTVATPLLSNEGDRLGVIAAHVNLAVLDRIIKDRTGLGSSGESYLVDAYNVLVSADSFGTAKYPRGIHSKGIDSAVQGQIGSGSYSNYADKAVFGIYRWIPERELALLSEIEASEALAPARRLGLTIGVVGLTAVGLLAVGVYLIARQIARPILAITDTAVKISAGDLTQMAPVLTEDETGVLARSFNHMTSRLRTTLQDLEVEQETSERLLLNVLPATIAKRLKQGEEPIVDSFSGVSVLFADIVGFTSFSTRLSPRELIEMLNQIFSAFDELSERHRLEKIKTIGDAYMVVGGLPTPMADHAESIAEMALDMQMYIIRFNAETERELSIRIGINSGPVVAGVVGTKKFLYDIWGDVVNTAARMESHGVGGRIQVTEETYQRLRHNYSFEDRGIVDVKGKGNMHVYFLTGRKTTAMQDTSERNS